MVHRLLVGGLVLAALARPGTASAASITHSTVADFSTGIATGAVQAQGWSDWPLFQPQPGGVGVMPTPAAPIINDDFNYADQAAAETAGWMFLTPNAADLPELVDNPTSFSFPTSGTLRIHASRPQDFWLTQEPGQARPVLVINKKALTGDFMVESKFTIQTPRNTNVQRSHGIIVTLPSYVIDGQGGDVTVDASTRYIVAAIQNDAGAITWGRFYADGTNHVAYETFFFTSQTAWIRMVKRGPYFYTFMKYAEAGPWMFHTWFKVPELAATPDAPVVAGIFEKSWGGTDTANLGRYQDTDYDYFKVNAVGADTGTFTNVMDAGAEVDWQAFSIARQSMPGVKYQLRTGNTEAGQTLTDAGSFVGPDGTSATWFGDHTAVIIPNGQGKRYLEYKFDMSGLTQTMPGQTAANLPAIVRSVTATYQPGGLRSAFLSTKADFGADTATVAVQPGDGDLGLKRTSIYRDDFANASETFGTKDTAGPTGWYFDPGDTFAVNPTAETSLTERPGWVRLKVGYEQDIFVDPAKKFGGVRLFRDAPSASDYEIETLVNVESQQAREIGLYLWQDVNNFAGVNVSHRDPLTLAVGVVDDILLGNGLPVGVNVNMYGSNLMQLRITKRGQIITMSVRDASSPDSAWLVTRVMNTAGLATGGTDFVPTRVGLMIKSYGYADRGTVPADYDYFQISTLPDSGTKDLTIPVAAGANLDTLVPLSDNGLSIAYQVKDAGGAFIGPDGTAGSSFSPDQPKLPASLNGQTNLTVRATFSNANPAGTPYLHALGAQYAVGGLKVVRDTNAADFAAGVTKSGVNVDTRPGAVVPEIALGTPVREEFNSTPAGWLFSNTPSGNSAVSYTESPGNARINMGRPEDLWGGPQPVDKPRIFLYNSQPVSGDYELETHVVMPNGREGNRHFGIGIVNVLPGGAEPNANLDMSHLMMFGPYQPDGMRFMQATGVNAFSDYGPGGYTGTDYYLRVRKIGSTFIGYARTNPADPWVEVTRGDNPTIGNAYIGLLGKSWPGPAPDQQPADYDFFQYTPLITTGTYESRVLDLGAAGLAPVVASQGGNSAGLQIQFRAADTEAGLASATYAGPDGTSATSYSGAFTGTLSNLVGKRYVQYKVTLPAGTVLNDLAIIGANAANLPLSPADVANALKIAGGLSTATNADKTRLDTNADGKVDILDAAKILRGVNGL